MSDEGKPKGYTAKQHIRELRTMVLNAWHTVCDTGAMSWEAADGWRRFTRIEHEIDIADLGWLDEEQLRLLLTMLDKMILPDTPEVDALFR